MSRWRQCQMAEVRKSLSEYILCVLGSCCFYAVRTVARQQAIVKAALAGDSDLRGGQRLTAVVRGGGAEVARA